MPSQLSARLEELRLQKDSPFLSGYSGSGSYVRPLDMVYRFASVEEGKVELDGLTQSGRATIALPDYDEKGYPRDDRV